MKCFRQDNILLGSIENAAGMPKSSAVRRSTKSRTHKLGGCQTCRRRHVKCDHIRPVCGICLALGLECDGYQTPIQWSANEQTQTRSFLYTETSRAHMIEKLSSDLLDGSVDSSLTHLDEQVNNLDLINGNTVNVGPFAIFSAYVESTLPTHPEKLVNAFELSTDNLQSYQNVQQDGFLPELDFSFNVGTQLNWADLFNFDMNGTDCGFDFGTTTLDPIYDGLQRPDGDYLSGNLVPIPNLEESRLSEEEILGQAECLLKNFKASIIPYFRAMPIDVKSSWELLNLNSAIKTLADLTYMQSDHVTHACKANLYATLGCSANHMMKTEDAGSPFTVTRMQTLVDYCGKEAKKNMQLTLSHETRAPVQAKYKDQLMATLGMVAYMGVTGNHVDARSYMVDAEKLLRIRGLQKQELSRRASLLHHVYSWTRINGESTYVLHDLSSPSLAEKVNAIISAASANTAAPPRHTELDDFLGIQNQTFAAVYPTHNRPTLGLRDIHMEDPRDWAHGMFPRICGLPQSWLSLVSQTTRFANVQDIAARHPAAITPPVAATIAAKIDCLRKMVHGFNLRSAPAPAADDETLSPLAAVRAHILAALSQSLLIFFHRRVRGSCVADMQPHVTSVVASLAAVDEPCTPWPAFMAGCEAERPEERAVLVDWMQRNVQRSGSAGYADAFEVMREVWRRRDAGEVVSWVEVARERQFWPMLF